MKLIKMLIIHKFEFYFFCILYSEYNEYIYIKSYAIKYIK